MAYDADAEKWEFSTYESTLEVDHLRGKITRKRTYEDVHPQDRCGSAYIFSTRLCTE
jgi:hypothetical protein